MYRKEWKAKWLFKKATGAFVGFLFFYYLSKIEGKNFIDTWKKVANEKSVPFPFDKQEETVDEMAYEQEEEETDPVEAYVRRERNSGQQKHHHHCGFGMCPVMLAIIIQQGFYLYTFHKYHKSIKEQNQLLEEQKKAQAVPVVAFSAFSPDVTTVA